MHCMCCMAHESDVFSWDLRHRLLVGLFHSVVKDRQSLNATAVLSRVRPRSFRLHENRAWPSA